MNSSSSIDSAVPLGPTTTESENLSTSACPNSLLHRLYISHTLSTWNSRTFEFGAVIFLATIFPGTLFFASCYALFRSLAAVALGSWIGGLVDRQNRLFVVRQSIIWQRSSVALSCLVLLGMRRYIKKDSEKEDKGWVVWVLFGVSVVLACVEKLAYIANTVAVERDWIVVVSESLRVEREDLNSGMRRIDLLAKLVAPVCIGLLDGYSTSLAIWVTFVQNALSVGVEYVAIAHVYAGVPALSWGKGRNETGVSQGSITPPSSPSTSTTTTLETKASRTSNFLAPYISFTHNPAFLASLALSLLYLTVLSFAGQMTTYLLTLGFTSTHVSLMRLVSVGLELSATCAAPILMKRIGAVRSGLWFINEQVASLALALVFWLTYTEHARVGGLALICGIIVSRLGLWGFDLCVQFLVQDATPPASRGSFSAVEMSLQNFFELVSFATTMVWYRPEDFYVPVCISGAAVAVSAACFSGFVRKRRGHLLHIDRCLQRFGKDGKGYRGLPTIEEEVELDEGGVR
ncbi:Ferroporti-1 [Ampelomyces quisqualis]|uniref:Solute carrier family 40 member n=1 Tax=Ampelomyces quisqualis TaxID=50730 RepID=A0A6A5QGG2_AMPQU|nr:Ferroporti-1 [Ampelomyces quisqualis]